MKPFHSYLMKPENSILCCSNENCGPDTVSVYGSQLCYSIFSTAKSFVQYPMS